MTLSPDRKITVLKLIKAHGGNFRGPHVEHLCMEEGAFWQFIAALAQVANPPRGEDPQVVRELRENIDDGVYIFPVKWQEKLLAHIDAQQSRIAEQQAEIERLKDFSPNPLAQPLKEAVAEVGRLKAIKSVILRALKQCRIEHCFDDSEFGIAIDAFLASSAEGCDADRG